MKKFMIIIKDEEGEVSVTFKDTWDEAEKIRMDAECGLGWYTELYERITEEYGETYERLY